MRQPKPTELTIRNYSESDERAVVELWSRCQLVTPQNDPRRDIALKMDFQPELFWVGTVREKIVATIMLGYEGHRGWINYLAVSPDHQKTGFGRYMMEMAEERLKTLGCPKINVQVRTTNLGVIEFYRRIGFGEDKVIGLGKRFTL